MPREQGQCVAIPGEIKKAMATAQEKTREANDTENDMQFRDKHFGGMDPGHHSTLARAHADAHAHNAKIASTLHTMGLATLAQKHRVQAAKHQAAASFHKTQSKGAAPLHWTDTGEAREEPGGRLNRLIERRRARRSA